MRGHLEVDQSFREGAEDLREDLRIALIARIHLGEHRKIADGNETEADEPLVVPLLLGVSSGRESSRRVFDKDVGGIEEQEARVGALLYEGPEDVLLDGVDHGPREEAAAAFLSLAVAQEALEVASEGREEGRPTERRRNGSAESESHSAISSRLRGRSTRAASWRKRIRSAE